MKKRQTRLNPNKSAPGHTHHKTFLLIEVIVRYVYVIVSFPLKFVNR